LTIGSNEDGANVGCELGSHIYAGQISAGVLLQVKLTRFPEDSNENRLASCLQPGVAVTGDELHTAQATGNQALQESTLMDFLLTQ
jgi:hypothetical protein